MNIKGVNKEQLEDDDDSGFNSKVVDFLKEKVKLDNGENGYVFTKNTDEHPRGRFRCHVCNVPIGSTKSLEEHASGKNHTKRMQANFHSHENFPKIVIKGTPKLFTGNSSVSNVGGKVITAPGVDIPDLAPGEPVPPGFEDIVTRVPEIKATLDEMKAPLIGLEYLAEITPVEDEIEPKYCCLLCNKRGDPRTVLAHLVCFNHRIKYIGRYFPRTNTALALIPKIKEYKRGTGEVLAKIVKAIEDKFGRLNPVIVDGAIFDQKKEEYYREMRDGRHFHETADSNYELLVDLDFIKKCAPEADTVLTIDIEKEEAKKKSTTLKSEMNKIKYKNIFPEHEKLDNKSHEKKFPQRNFNLKTKRERSVETISSSGSRSYSRSRSRSRSGSFSKSHSRSRPHYRHSCRDYFRGTQKRSRSPRYYYRSQSRTRSRTRSRSRSGSRSRSRSVSRSRGSSYRKYRASNYRVKSPVYARSSYRTVHYNSLYNEEDDYKSSEKMKNSQTKVAELRDQRRKRDLYAEFVENLEKDMAKSLKNYKKNPEKHPLYPEEWKKFWNRRYKELTAEGIDASKHDFKPEWIKFWLVRMRELHNEELEMKKEKYRAELGLSELDKTSGIDSDVIEVSPTPLEDEKSSVTVDDIKNTWKALTGSEIKSSNIKALDKTGKFESKSEQPVKVLTVLRLLTALESQLGSLGPRVNNLLSQAIALEKKKASSSDSLIDVSENQVLFETVKEKLKGQLFAGIVEKPMVNATRIAIQNVAELFNYWKTRKENPEPAASAGISVPVTATSSEPLIVPGIGAVDKVSIAQQIAAALVAQGKTNITEQELEQLINAVVGMAQATTRHTQIAPAVVGMAQVTTRHTQITPAVAGIAQATARHSQVAPVVTTFPAPTVTTFATPTSQVPSTVTSSAISPVALPAHKELETVPTSLILHRLVSKSGWGSTSLNLNMSQILDEGPNPKCKKGSVFNDVTDLSEDDMKMLLQNFKDLAAEDQQSLIAYLKELESKDPDSVEKLRKFVDSANENAGKTENKTKEESHANERLSPFSMREGGANPFIDDGSKTQAKDLDDDEDDYSYEEIYKAAEKKVSGKSVVEQMIEEQQKKVKLTQSSQPSQSSPQSEKNNSRETLKVVDDPECVLSEAKVMIANIMGQLPTKYNGGATRNVITKVAANLKTTSTTETSSAYLSQPAYDVVKLQNSHMNKMSNNLLNDYNYQDDIFEYSNDSFHNYSTSQENYHVESTSNEPYNQIQQSSYSNFGNSEQTFSNYESWNDSYSQYPPPSQQQVNYSCPPPNLQPPMVDSSYSRPLGSYQTSPPNDYNGPPLYNAYRNYY